MSSSFEKYLNDLVKKAQNSSMPTMPEPPKPTTVNDRMSGNEPSKSPVTTESETQQTIEPPPSAKPATPLPQTKSPITQSTSQMSAGVQR
jgi:hypothetical protein